MSTSSTPRRTSPLPPGAEGAGDTTPHDVGAAAKAAAVGLWVVVGGGLLYGVIQTVIRATQLFA